MKKITLLFAILCLVFSTLAQAPACINYQTIIRGADGQILSDTELAIQLTIRKGASDGEVVYSEIHSVNTTTFGLANLVIGNGQVESGQFSQINWGANSHYLETAVDIEGNGEYEIMGVAQFQNVPYALYAKQAGDTTQWNKEGNVVYYNQGQVAIGTSQPDSSAALDVTSNTQGFLPPRMTTEERDAITNPAAGLIIFNTNTHCINFFNGEEWVEWGRDPMDTFECGQVFTDQRDKQQYRTVKIGGQCWFAENLNYGNKVNANSPQSDNEQVEKYCYENIPANCLEYGGLYQWDEMMAYDTVEFTQGICPDGWHLPNQTEWQTLIDAYGGMGLAGGELVASGTSGFDALMNGKYETATSFSKKGDLSTFWSSTGIPGATGTGFDIENGNLSVNTSNAPVSNAYGLRCLQGLPNRADPNLKVIDTTVYHLISDSLELLQGIYRYEIIGNRKAKDIIVADNIVVGAEGEGYLRKVDETISNGNEMTLTTSGADMEDAFVEGEFDFGSELAGEKGPAYTFTRVIYTAPGVEIIPSKDGFHYEFTDVELYSGNNITVSIPQGHVTLDPNFKYEFKFKNKKVKKLAFYANETLYENSLDVFVEATAQVGDDTELTLAKFEKTLLYWIPSLIPIPIVIVITTELRAEFSYNYDAAFSATTGYTNTNYLSLGMKYEYGSWQKIWNLEKETVLHPFVWDGNVALNQSLQIIPEISVELYGVAGPYFNLPLWGNLEANLALPEWNYDASLDVGLNGNIGAAVTLFGKTLASYNKELFGFEKNLYKTPYELEMISGNNQTGSINTQLPDPLKVKVSDSKGLTSVPVMVHFSVETGSGNLSETDVLTDGNGYAQTYWTMGAEPGTNELTAIVQKADGSQINSSPLQFTATATSGGNAPIADFTANPTSGAAPLTVNFTDQSTNTPTSWQWDFGDGNISIQQNPSYTYQNVGDYSVELTVSNNNGTDLIIKNNYINITNGGGGDPCPGIETFTYEGLVYNTVLIGNQCWFKENLNFEAGNSWCFANDPGNCDVYGRLYDWETALSVCPTGWHLPSDEEWKTLEGNVDSQYGVGNPVWDDDGFRGFDAGLNLKSTSGWNSNGNGADLYGFLALPGGYLNASGSFYYQGIFAYWWSSSEHGTSTAWSRNLYFNYDQVQRNDYNKSNGFSVRCIKD